MPYVADQFMQDVAPGDVVVFPAVSQDRAIMMHGVFVEQVERPEGHGMVDDYYWKIAFIKHRKVTGDNNGEKSDCHQTTYFNLETWAHPMVHREAVLLVKADDLEKIRELFGQPVCGKDLDPFIVMQKAINEAQGLEGVDRQVTTYVESWKAPEGK